MRQEAGGALWTTGRATVRVMRWDRLFDDLEAQLAAADAAARADEVAERTRLELAHVELADRVLAGCGQQVTVHLPGGRRLVGRVREAAQQWLLLDGPPATLVRLGAVYALSGLGPAAATADRDGVARRYGLTAVLRVVARDRSPVHIGLVDGEVLTGTIDAVGTDHFDLAEHPPDEPRRSAQVRAVRCVSLSALATVQPAVGTTSW